MDQLEILRVDKALEVIGMDIAELGGLTEKDFRKIRGEVRYRLEKEEAIEQAAGDKVREAN